MADSVPVTAQPKAQAPPLDRSDKYVSKMATVQTIGKNKVVIGHGSVIHPFAVLKPTNGPILIGEYCVIDEACVIENKCTGERDMQSIFELFPAGVAKTFGPNFGANPALNNMTEPAPGSEERGAPNIPPTTLCIGNNNYFGPRVRIEAAAIGDGNVFEPMSSVGIMAVVQDGCHLRAATRVTHDGFLPSFTVVEGSGGGSQWRTNPAVTESWCPTTDPLLRSCSSDRAVPTQESDEDVERPADGSSGVVFTSEQLQAQFLKDVSEKAQARSRYLRKVLK